MDDLELPRAVVARIIKSALPDGVIVATDAKSALNTASRVFISYITAMANDLAQQSNRKTLTAQDVIKAMEETEFPQFCDPLNETLTRYKKDQQEKKGKKKDAAKARKESESAATMIAEGTNEEEKDAQADSTHEVGQGESMETAKDGATEDMSSMDTQEDGPIET